MYICKDCGATYQVPVNFCSRCGSNVIVDQNGAMPAFTEQLSAAYPYVDPVPPYVAATPEVRPAASESKVPAILGLIFGCSALYMAVFSIFWFFLSDIYNDLLLTVYSSEIEVVTAWTAVITYFILTLPASIVGLIQSSKAVKLPKLAKVGKITSILSFVFLGISLLLPAIFLA